MSMAMNSEQPEYVFLPSPTDEPGAGGKRPDGPIVRPRRRFNPLLWLVIGIPLGVLATIAGQKLLETPPPHFVRLNPGLQSAVPTPSLSPAPTVSPSPSATPDAGGPSPAEPTGPFSLVPGIFQPGMSALGGPMPSGPIMMPPVIPGNVPSLPNVGANGSSPQAQPPGGVPPATVESPPVALVTMLMPTGEADMDAAENKVRSVANKFGGRSLRFFELAEKKESDRTALLIMVPASKRESATSALRKMGATVDDNWEGKPEERQLLLQEKLILALHDLQHEREKLLVKYFADATPVKEMDERIKFTENQLASVRVGSAAKLAIFRVYVGPNA